MSSKTDSSKNPSEFNAGGFLVKLVTPVILGIDN